jgi:hypothetical protein
MSEQTWMDTSAVQTIGQVFLRSAGAVDLASGEMVDCSFGRHVGTRYAAHAEHYTAGLLRLRSSIDRFAESSSDFAVGLADAVTAVTGEDNLTARGFNAADNDVVRG